MEITKRIAINTAIEEKIVKDVITHSMNSILRNARTCESMEMTGFGNFYLKTNRIPPYLIKLKGRIEKLKVHLTTLTNKQAIKNLEKLIKQREKDFDELNKRYGME